MKTHSQYTLRQRIIIDTNAFLTLKLADTASHRAHEKVTRREEANTNEMANDASNAAAV